MYGIFGSGVPKRRLNHFEAVGGAENSEPKKEEPENPAP